MSGWAMLEKALAGRWIAGPEIRDAVSRVRRFNSMSIAAEINYLGEDFTAKSDVDDAVSTYIRLIAQIKRSRLDADISLKPTQLGLTKSFKLVSENYRKIVSYARRNGVFVWLDMEDEAHVDDTIRLYMGEVEKGGVGICIQSYLKRSAADLRKIVPRHGAIRLVKGAYSTAGRGAFKSKRAIDRDYIKLMEYLFEHCDRFMVATHDPRMIRIALKLEKRHRKKVTYAMLNGIRDKYAASLARKGERVSLYVPFGSRWVDYSYRRLKEAGHLSLLVRSLFERQSV